MNTRAKRRLAGVTIVVIAVIGVLIFFVGQSNATATPVTIADALTDESLVGTQVEVTGEVVAGSWMAGSDPFTFDIEDSSAADSGKLTVIYDHQIPSSFGDGTTATVTGELLADGTIEAKYLVTKCPSKYESATSALTVTDTLNRATELEGVTVKVAGFVLPGTIADAGAAVRFQIADAADAASGLGVAFSGALPDDLAERVQVVVTGSLRSDGTFECTDVAIAE